MQRDSKFWEDTMTVPHNYSYRVKDIQCLIQ